MTFECKSTLYDGTDPNLAQLHECKNATLCYTQLVNYNTGVASFNDNQKLSLAAKITAWNVKEKEYKDKLIRWENKTGEFEKWRNRETELSNEQRPWNNCLSAGNLDCNAGKKNSYCENDIGQGWFHSGKTSCGFGNLGCKGICSRTSLKITQDLSAEGYFREKPEFTDPKPTQEKDNPLMEQNTTTTDISCCSNYIDFTGDVKNVSQSCGQELDKRLSAPPFVSPVVAPVSPVVAPEIYIEEDYMFLIIVILCILISGCISISCVMLLKKS